MMRWRDLPNLISVIRLLAVIPVVWLLLERQFGWALVLFAGSAASDGVDGFLARHYGWQSRLGGILDPLADKTLLVSCFLVLGSLGLIPVWLVVVAIFRDLLIVAGAVLYNYRVAELQAAPIVLSKLNTLMQILLVVAVITNAGPLPLPAALLQGLTILVLLTVIGSGAQYVWIWSRKAMVQVWHDD